MESFWNRLDISPPPVFYPAHEKDEFNRGEIKKLSTILQTSVQTEKDLWQSLTLERYLLSRMIYKANNSHRREKGFQALRKVLRCVVRFEATNKNLLAALTEPFDSVTQNASVVHLPSKQMLEYALVRLTGCAKLLSQAIQYCLESHLYTLQQLEHGLFWQNNSVFAGLISRLWIICWTWLRSTCDLYSKLLPWLEKLKPSSVDWLPDDVVLLRNLYTDLNLPRCPSEIGLAALLSKSWPTTDLSQESGNGTEVIHGEDLDILKDAELVEDIGESIDRSSLCKGAVGDNFQSHPIDGSRSSGIKHCSQTKPAAGLNKRKGDSLPKMMIRKDKKKKKKSKIAIHIGQRVSFESEAAGRENTSEIRSQTIVNSIQNKIKKEKRSTVDGSENSVGRNKKSYCKTLKSDCEVEDRSDHSLLCSQGTANVPIIKKKARKRVLSKDQTSNTSDLSEIECKDVSFGSPVGHSEDVGANKRVLKRKKRDKTDLTEFISSTRGQEMSLGTDEINAVMKKKKKKKRQSLLSPDLGSPQQTCQGIVGNTGVEHPLVAVGRNDSEVRMKKFDTHEMLSGDGLQLLTPVKVLGGGHGDLLAKNVKKLKKIRKRDKGKMKRLRANKKINNSKAMKSKNSGMKKRKKIKKN